MAAIDAIASKYEAEREKRFNAISAGGGGRLKFRSTALMNNLDQDPWADYDNLAKQTPPLRDGSEIRFLILGAGHNGILFACHLIAAGFKASEIVIVDGAGGFGGTWYWNRYPGLTCDVEGYCYLPLLEETGFVPKHRYSKGEEIRQNVEGIAEKFGIQGMFCTKAKSADWDETQKRWNVKLSRDLGPNHQDLSGDFVVRVQFLMPAGGLFYSPSAPDAPGLEGFMKNREIFHTARWNYAYTGGSQSKPDLVNLQDKRVGIIGTGATAVQAVPELAKWAKQLYVFQRTPSYCGPREQVETTSESWAKIAGEPGWQSKRVRNLNKYLNDHPEAVPEDDLLKDGWSRARQFSGLIGSPRAKDITPAKVPEHLKRMMELDAGIATDLRKHVDHEVDDPEVAEKLKAWYPGWCKRPTFHQDYLKSFNRPNVTLVDTDGQGISGYTDGGILVGKGESAKEYEVDVLVLATGFATTTGVDGDPAQVLDMFIRGRDGRSLTDKWKADDFATFFGVATHDFPNLLFYTAKGATGSANTTYPLTIAAKTVAHIAKTAVEQATDASRLEVEVSKEAEQRYTESLKPYSPWYATVASCTPTYFTDYRDPTKTKNPENKKGPTVGWSLGTVAFEEAVDKWIDGGLEGFAVRG
ncbi:FAD-binding monooxygenase ausC [Colletotrichum siamense]|uniref:FAD-binding monooxygenase ausC n=1 Tax=Colletotrichum siamense TaxID=690259 RepID=A0A9P5K8E1_COLSI|nr:FAD-binding monooxygenase ausC [Colletotrichum siamense]KAF4863010.1 FAD-binding monooxygenase ausC [Colletotrichum siamense]